MFSRTVASRLANVTLTPQQAEGAQLAMQHWKNASLVSSTLATQLLSTIEIQEPGFDWERLAKYSFRLAVVCLAISLVSLIADKLFLKLIWRILEVPPVLRAGITALVAVAVNFQAYIRTLAYPEQKYLNEAIHGIGAMLFALADFQLGEAIEVYIAAKFDSKEGELPKAKAEFRDKWFPYLFLLLAAVYGTTGFLAETNVIWSLGYITLAGFLGAQTSYSWGSYYLGMATPVKFVEAGVISIGMAYAFREWEPTVFLYSSTRIWGMLYLFVSLWILSIYGNNSDVWEYNRRQFQVSRAVWSLTFLVVAMLAILHGLNFRDSTTKGFGLTFISINLYTKAFEYLWEALYQPLFFALLAGSLALIGKYAETVWNLSLP